jgi:hypothetical protein
MPSCPIRDVLKREVVEGEKADEARKKINKVASKQSRARKSKQPAEREDKGETKPQ